MRAIAAMDLNRVIGHQKGIPWKLSEDMKYFKRMTTDPEIGGKMVMGRNTFRTMGDLPKRFTYIITHDVHVHDCNHCYWDDVKHKYVTPVEFARILFDTPGLSDTMWLCGGAKVYELLMPMCSELYLTIVLGEYEGDTFMPEFDEIFPYSEILVEAKEFWRVRYWK